MKKLNTIQIAIIIAIIFLSVGFGLSINIGVGFVTFGGIMIFLAPLIFGIFNDDIYK